MFTCYPCMCESFITGTPFNLLLMDFVLKKVLIHWFCIREEYIVLRENPTNAIDNHPISRNTINKCELYEMPSYKWLCPKNTIIASVITALASLPTCCSASIGAAATPLFMSSKRQLKCSTRGHGCGCCSGKNRGKKGETKKRRIWRKNNERKGD